MALFGTRYQLPERLALAVIPLGSIALSAGAIHAFPRYPSARIDGVEVVGEAATAIAFLVVIVSISRFRSSLDAEVYYPLVSGFTFLYFSAFLDFLDEFLAVGKPLTYAVENVGGVVGAICLAVAFGYWLTQYEERGRKLTAQEDQLQRRNEQLETLNRIVNHDIRNDLNVVDGRIRLAMEKGDPDVNTHLRKALGATTDAIALIDTAYEFVDMVTEGGERALEPLPLHEVLSAQVDRVRRSYSDAEIDYTAPSSDVHVLADRMVSAVFRNLLVNAVKHNDNPVPHVAVSVTDRGEAVAVRVADDGPGIPDEMQSRVFDRGELGPKSPGTGVGLHLVDQLVSRYGGEVRLEDGEPSGTVFEVRLRKG